MLGLGGKQWRWGPITYDTTWVQDGEETLEDQVGRRANKPKHPGPSASIDRNDAREGTPRIEIRHQHSTATSRVEHHPLPPTDHHITPPRTQGTY
ncbi:hypothetical protein BD779DRAFT_1541353, partial [Infundibulicybe gibba]